MKSPQNVNSDMSEDIELSVANLPEPNNQDMNQMRVEVLGHILENKSQYNPRLLSYSDLPILKKHQNKDAFRNTMNSFAN